MTRTPESLTPNEQETFIENWITLSNTLANILLIEQDDVTLIYQEFERLGLIVPNALELMIDPEFLTK